MKTTRYNVLMLAAMATMTLASCSDDDNVSSSSPISVDKVFLENFNSSVPDREVEFARLGQLIRIQGSGFTGLRKVYVNGYETYFNNALLTDNNIWLTLNSNTPVDKAEEDVRNTIRFVKDATELSYPFIIRASMPTVSSVDNTLPQPGETVTVYGANLQETTKLTLPGGVEVTSGITSDEDGQYYTFTMPSGVTEAGTILSEGANGEAETPEYFNDFRTYVINYDADGHGDMGGWSATFKAEDLVDDPLNTGRGKVVQIIPQSYLDENPDGVKGGTPSIKGYYTAGNDSPDDDWSRMYTYIAPETPVDSVALQFDVYVPEEWDLTGQVEFTLQNNLSTYGYGSADTEPSDDYLHQAAVWIPWLNEDGSHTPFTTGERWQTITLPITKFGNYSAEDTNATFQKVVEDRNAGSYRNLGVLFCNGDIEYSESISYPATTTKQRIYIDNLRIVKITAIEKTDFPEEEE